MRDKKTSDKRNVLIGFLAGVCVVLSCAQASDLIVYAKDVLFNDDVAKLNAANVQEAVEKVAAKAGSVDWSNVANRPAGLDDGDNVNNFTAGTGIKIDGTSISADVGTSSGQVASGDHGHADLAITGTLDFGLYYKSCPLTAAGSNECYCNEADEYPLTWTAICTNAGHYMKDSRLRTYTTTLGDRQGVEAKCWLTSNGTLVDAYKIELLCGRVKVAYWP
jgi:hypothetical protein